MRARAPKYVRKEFMSETRKQRSSRDGFGDALLDLGRTNPRVVVLTADLAESTRVEAFAKQFPKRFFDVGVAEQNLLGVAAGLALSGKVPFATSYVAFSPGRNWDQLRVSVCYSQTNVKVVSTHAGLSVGPDGATHQGMEDLAMTRVLPNLTVVVPADYAEAYQATLALAKYEGPVYMRLSREPGSAVTSGDQLFHVGKARVLREGADVTLVACGLMVEVALEAADVLAARGIAAEVLNVPTIKPLDSVAIRASAWKTGAVVTIEEHQVTAGLGGAVCECLVQDTPVPMEFVGMPDRFGESGTAAELLKKYGLDALGVLRAVQHVLSRKTAR